ncbi:MAG: TIR domain-containing protein [Chloroflexi bacterium]|nr:TIR domain-containing protein [Chloroflexota bacterium]
MIRITYSEEQKALAERIRDDLAGALEPGPPLLIVLVSAASTADPLVQAELADAQATGERILPILADGTGLPPAFGATSNMAALDFSRAYSRERLLAHVARAKTSQAALRRANRRALAAMALLAALVFGIAIITMSSGLIAFPVAEYNEEATFQAEWIDGLIRATLEAVQPRTTEDALNFAATHQAAPTRLFYYIRETATALARQAG